MIKTQLYKINSVNDILLILFVFSVVVIVLLYVYNTIYELIINKGIRENIRKEGCIIRSAINYDASAEIDDGSCEYSRYITCNSNGQPNEDGYCICDPGYGGIDCNTYNGFDNIIILTNEVIFYGEEYIVNTVSLKLNRDTYLLPCIITINDLTLDEIYINYDNLNIPPLLGDTNPNNIYNTYFSVGDYIPDITIPSIEQINWPNPNRFIWGKYRYSITEEPIKIFQLTLKKNTNKTENIIFKYANDRFIDYIQYIFSITNGSLVINP